ncbi:MAG: hypothetical protein L0154_30410 [Chloroflexi bacterium]|nr:hypothetical protein [Chloroflexota bacterium]
MGKSTEDTSTIGSRGIANRGISLYSRSTLWPVGGFQKKVKPIHEPVPNWHELPPYAQADLSRHNCGHPYFKNFLQNEFLRLTVLNLYVKLKALGLWKFVNMPKKVKQGEFEFECSDIGLLWSILDNKGDFSQPDNSPDAWDSREWRWEASIHFKHYKSFGHRLQDVAVHIDRYGIRPGPPLVPDLMLLATTAMHVYDFVVDGYQEVLEIRSILRKQGFDPLPLFGLIRDQ